MSCCVQGGVVIVDRGEAQCHVVLGGGGGVGGIVDRGESQGVMECSGRRW